MKKRNTAQRRSGPAREVEVKFEVPAQAIAALQEELARRSARQHRLEARYYDTADGRLAAQRMALRLRREGGHWVQALKVEDRAGPWARLEHEVVLPDDAASIDPSRHANTEAGDVLQRALSDGAMLVERYRADVTRTACEIELDGTRVELAFDQGALEAGGAQAAVSELEFELKQGDPKRLAAIARPWIRALGLWLQPESKAVRGERLRAAGTSGPLPVVKASTPKLDPSACELSSLRAIVRNCLEQVLPNASAIAAGSDDPEHVHQMRVGLRRLRTVIRDLGDAVPPRALQAHEPALAWAFRQLGQVRDRETVLASLRPRLAEAGAKNFDWAEVAAGDARPPAEIARSPRLQWPLVALLAFTVGEDDALAGAPGLAPRLRKRLRRLHKQVSRAGARFHKLPDDERHRARKRLKRLRYLSEFALPWYDAKSVERYLDALKPAQEVLGMHNDLVTAAAMAEPAARLKDKQARFALDWLRAQQKACAREGRKALRKVAGVPRFWAAARGDSTANDDTPSREQGDRGTGRPR